MGSDVALDLQKHAPYTLFDVFLSAG